MRKLSAKFIDLFIFIIAPSALAAAAAAAAASSNTTTLPGTVCRWTLPDYTSKENAALVLSLVLSPFLSFNRLLAKYILPTGRNWHSVSIRPTCSCSRSCLSAVPHRVKMSRSSTSIVSTFFFRHFQGWLRVRSMGQGSSTGRTGF